MIKPTKDSDRYETPPEVFEAIDRAFGPFNLDVCAERSTAKCAEFFTVEHDALSQNWGNRRCWMNPPYSDPMPWVKKALTAACFGARVVALLPADSSTNWYHTLKREENVILIHPPGRIRFLLDGKRCENTAKFGSLIAIIHPHIGRLR